MTGPPEINLDDLPHDLRKIAELIGIDALFRLSAALGGDSLHIPHPERLSVTVRNRDIRAAFNGRNYRELAIRHGLTVRWIRAIVAGKRGPEAPETEKIVYKKMQLF